tara:strand:+ start:196 stop:396 length:201 start_codon:yes stop_codon:yes gene_type:complete
LNFKNSLVSPLYPFSYHLFRDRKDIIKVYRDISFVLKTLDGSLLVTDYTVSSLMEGDDLKKEWFQC